MAIKKNDFVELEFTGRLKEDNTVIDTTNEKIAKDNNIYSDKHDYGPVIICVGQNHILKGLDRALLDHELGEFDIELNPEDAFGKKDAKLIRLLPTSQINEHNIHPYPGLPINIDGILGTIKSVSGGRTLVDFNHPLAGKKLIYNIKINRIIDDTIIKITSFLKQGYGINKSNVQLQNNIAKIKTEKALGTKTQEQIKKNIKETIPEVHSVEFGI